MPASVPFCWDRALLRIRQRGLTTMLLGKDGGRFHAATRCMSAEAGSIRSGPLLAAAPGPAATASGGARFGEHPSMRFGSP